MPRATKRNQLRLHHSSLAPTRFALKNHVACLRVDLVKLAQRTWPILAHIRNRIDRGTQVDVGPGGRRVLPIVRSRAECTRAERNSTPALSYKVPEHLLGGPGVAVGTPGAERVVHVAHVHEFAGLMTAPAPFGLVSLNHLAAPRCVFNFGIAFLNRSWFPYPRRRSPRHPRQSFFTFVRLLALPPPSPCRWCAGAG